MDLDNKFFETGTEPNMHGRTIITVSLVQVHPYDVVLAVLVCIANNGMVIMLDTFLQGIQYIYHRTIGKNGLFGHPETCKNVWVIPLNTIAFIFKSNPPLTHSATHLGPPEDVSEAAHERRTIFRNFLTSSQKLRRLRK